MRILIVDDQHRTRQSLGKLLKTIPAIKGIWEAADGQQALQVVPIVQPHLVVMDARMPIMDGLESSRIIKEKWPEIKVIILSMYLEYQERAIQAGADAFVSKGDPPERLLQMVCMLLEAGR